ncbi:MAG: hypothetical protein EZS28_026507 [Streblomastix strix]|uniref:Uncharacterized protein n=1 Tax=Streblomastix strix TaxID=222440 RepID=A0A5J4V782_9EUKA|nr:MAG: hypothetical protein EZS28_026507 [Streblomastix strix]
MVQVTPEPYNREAIDEMLDKKLNISDQIDAYNKTEVDALLDDKLNISDQIDAYSKIEADALLDDKLNISDQIDAYSKIEADALLDNKLNISDQIDAYSKTEDDALLLLKADKTELIDAYTKQEADALLDDKLNISDQIDAFTKQEANALLDEKLNISDQIDAYNKSEVDALLDDKLNITDQIDAYNKIEVDALLDDKLNITDQVDAYNKTEADALLDDKLNISDQIDAYSKQEDDALLLLKADKTELADYVDLASTQTISGQKQFGIVSVSSISKQNKNDASILLAGGGDMLVSSLVSQPQLQEVRDIASVDKQVMDYWWDGSNLRALETELPDMSNVMTILGAATGGGNAITDLSFDGNTLIPPKNSSFITTNYDETITGQKTFYTTIHSVGISVQNYDNNSVVCAGGGVKAIQDINASVDFSNYYNKSQTNSQTETDQKLNLKLNISDQIDAYTKTQDDALLLLKADKTQLIDAYSKTEADALLDDKLNVSDQIDAYTKTQDDALLLLKADKTQLIDSYTKGETNNLLNNKADSGVSYIKGEDDALLLLKADKTQLIDSYTKGEADNLLSNKANSGVSYTKGEDDALLLLKANQSSTYTKTETDYLISQIEVGDVDLSGYLTLGTSQTITVNKTFNNACRFISSIDGMGTITGSSFIKSGADDTVVLLGAGGTKPISEFGSGSVDDSTFVKKNGIRTLNNSWIYGTKTIQFKCQCCWICQTGKDDTLVLLAGGGDQLLSAFGGVQVEDITSPFYTLMMEIIPRTQIATSTQTTICIVESISNTITPPTPPSTTYPISLATKRKTLTCIYSYRDFKISTDSTEAWGINDDVGLQFSWML